MHAAGKGEQPNLIFLHIPKSAGTTLNFILESHFSREESYSVSKSNYYPGGSIDGFKAMSPERHAKIRWLTGHMGYGYHDYLSGPSVYVTLLRDPVERLISNYYFERHLRESPIHEMIRSGKMDLREYVYYYYAIEMDNLQTRMIAGNWEKRGDGPCTPEMLEQAKQNLQDHFAVVGVARRFDEFYFLLRHYFGWRYVPYVTRNKTKSRPRREEVPTADRQMIKEYNRYDIELFKFAKEMFETQLAAYSPKMVQASLTTAAWRNELFKKQLGLRTFSLRHFIREHSVRAYLRQRLHWD
ncbi:MAG: sulfotransferase family 2 domain-containing protein [Chloroflexota bacterium]